MTTLLVFWLVATVALAVLLGVIMLVQLVWPGRRQPLSRLPQAVDEQQPSEASRRAA